MTLVNQRPGMNVLSGDALSPLSGSIFPVAAASAAAPWTEGADAPWPVGR